MANIELKYSRNQVKKAGKILKTSVSSQENRSFADEVLTNWRGCHLYPINTFRVTLTKKISQIDPTGLIAQRLKRTPSIVLKLQRFPAMSLPLMQDIGGIRAVLTNLSKVREIEASYLKGNLKHQLVSHKDYINFPKDSGYRGVHLIYKYNNNRVSDYNGMFIEIQLRTKLQHIWATAVETMGAFLNYSLKSSDGPDEWLNFFALTSASFCVVERTPVPNQFRMNDPKKIIELTINEAKRLNVFDHFNGFRVAANEITSNKKKGSFHLIKLDLDKKMVSIRSYGRRKLDEANKLYSELEEEILKGKNLNIVLVSASSLDSLRKAYPNYFLDTADFLKQLSNLRNRISSDGV